VSPQLQLELDAKKRRARATAGLPLWRRCLYWAPVWLPLMLLTQVVAFGLRPAWLEGQRLGGSEAHVDARAGRLDDEYVELVRDRRKLADPIYRERVRRGLRDLGRAPLTLESTRNEDS
jgi:hypothetical protein